MGVSAGGQLWFQEPGSSLDWGLGAMGQRQGHRAKRAQSEGEQRHLVCEGRGGSRSE